MIMGVFNPNQAPTLDEQIRARGKKFVENHDLEVIEETINEVEKLEGRESAVTGDILRAMSEREN